ncbi:potassium channel protein [Methanocella sp. CWC-04]|uniref:Potassium channel protein n=1 Tax=Methanooceanicella nereidis TaxID=2052831 RepID=A0AAP2RE40_9EURY|nr:potassium channel protein [Methanocella sp. CWC-04]
MYHRIKSRVYEILENSLQEDGFGKAFNIFIIVLICLNVTAVVLETEESLASQYGDLFWNFEVFSVAIFSIEYILRLWTCNLNPEYTGMLRGRIKYIFTPFAIIDLLAIMPFYLPMILPADLLIIRALRLFRLFRIFKLGRYSESMQTFINVINNKKEELTITVVMGFLLLLIASALMYTVEHDVQPDKFSSILTSMWWGVITLATVGYGDVVPMTPLGKFLGSIIALLGIGLFALPTGIMGSGFVEELHKRKETEKRICPHCGKDMDEPPEKHVPIEVPEPLTIKIIERKNR